MKKFLRVITGSEKLLTKDDKRRMLENGRRLSDAGDPSTCDLIPVVKLFTPDADCIWLLAALDPSDPDMAFGLCDLGMGHPELTRIRLSEIESVRGPLGERVARAANFSAEMTIEKYADQARMFGRISA